MKRIYYLSLLLPVLIYSCDKSSTPEWSEEDRAYHDHVMTLQETAIQNFESWLQTMDTAEAALQMQQFFLADTSVVSAEVGSQGLAVQYSNGIRGGVFFDPEDDFDTTSLLSNQYLKIESSGEIEKSLVNKKKAILLNPHYWQRSGNTDNLIAAYNNYLPKVSIGLDAIYKNQDATLDRFTQLSGFGFIHVYSHGWAWPKKEDYVEVYLLTGEIVNSASSMKYWNEILNGNILLAESETGNNSWDNVYYIRKDFITAHNDFSKDTVLFYGGFCFSFLGSWSGLSDNFASGDYFGYTWRVQTNWNCTMAKSLLGEMTDTTISPVSTGDWLLDPNPVKQKWDGEDQKFCQLWSSGNPDLVLWKAPAKVTTNPVSGIGQTTATCGGNVISDGGFPVTARGVCWSLNPNPTVNDNHTTDGSGTGAFTSAITGLSEETPYFVRAYATNSQETFYGDQKSFTTTSGTLYIGKPYQGGKIFYLDGQHGLIVDTMNHGQDNLPWGCMGLLLGTTSTAIGSGLQNTEAIVNGCSEETPARYCYNMDWYGYTDWFLPSKDEMNEIYLHKDVLGSFFSSGVYLSSSEIDADNCWAQDFAGGIPGQQFVLSKIPAYDWFRVRAF